MPLRMPIIFRNYGALMKNASTNIRDDLRIEPGRHIDLLKDYDPGYTGNFVKKEETGEALEQGIHFLAEQQDKAVCPEYICPADNPAGFGCRGKRQYR